MTGIYPIQPHSHCNFKMRMSDRLKEQILKEDFKGNTKKFHTFENNFKESFSSVDDSTVIDLEKNENNVYRAVLTNENFPGKTVKTAWLFKKLKNSRIADKLLGLCHMNFVKAEEKLVKKGLAEMADNFTPAEKIHEAVDKTCSGDVRKSDYMHRFADDIIITKEQYPYQSLADLI